MVCEGRASGTTEAACARDLSCRELKLLTPARARPRALAASVPELVATIRGGRGVERCTDVAQDAARTRLLEGPP